MFLGETRQCVDMQVHRMSETHMADTPAHAWCKWHARARHARDANHATSRRLDRHSALAACQARQASCSSFAKLTRGDKPEKLLGRCGVNVILLNETTYIPCWSAFRIDFRR